LRNLNYTFFLFLVAIGHLGAQLSLQHDKAIKGLDLDEKKGLLATDIRGENFQLVNGQLLISKEPIAIDSIESDYEIQNGQLKKNLGQSYQLFDLPFEPQSFTKLKDKILLASESDLWILENGQAKKYFIPGVRFPTEVVKLGSSEELIGMLTADRSLYIYHSKNQVIKFIDNQVEDFVIDGWQTVWYAKGNQLLNLNSFSKPQPPVFKLLALKNASGKTLTDPIILEEEQEELSIHFQIHYPPLMDKASVLYCLNKGEWIKVESRNQVLIKGLKEGNNEILLKAAGLDDQVVTKSLKVKVKEASFARYWPWLLGGLIFLFALNLFSQFRMKTEMKSLETEKEKLRLQLQVESERQKLGQLQMNPHFIFNTLNSISGLIALNENKKARANLNSFSKMMRNVLDHSQKDFIPLSAELQFLKSYLDLEQLIRNGKFEYSIESTVDDSYLVPPMILQPFLENAIVHGLNPKEKQGDLSLKLIDDQKHIKVIIEDNGIGRAKAALNKREGHESAAIKIIEQRLKNLNKWDKLGLVYEDLLSEEGHALGTRVLLHLPKRKR